MNFSRNQKNYTDIYKDTRLSEILAQRESIIRARLEYVQYNPNNRVLDVACGVSLFGKTFGKNVYGFDVNPAAVTFAKRNGVRAKIADAEDVWNYPNNYFDIVIANHIIEHVVNPDKLILEAKRVLKRGGLFIVITPNLAAWFNRILLLLGAQPFFTEVSTVDKTLGLKFTRKFTSVRNPMGHLRIFTVTALVDILTLHGFHVIKSHGEEFFPLPRVLFLIDKIFTHIVSLASNIMVIAKKS